MPRPDADAVTLRVAARADRAFVRALADEAFGHLGDYRATLLGWLEDPGARTRLAECRGEPAGFAIAAPVRWGEASPAMDLVAVAVVPSARRRGVGRALLRSVLGEHAAGLHVAPDNAPARALFETEGFVYRPGDDLTYPDGRPALRMGRGLETA